MSVCTEFVLYCFVLYQHQYDLDIFVDPKFFASIPALIRNASRPSVSNHFFKLPTCNKVCLSPTSILLSVFEMLSAP